MDKFESEAVGPFKCPFCSGTFSAMLEPPSVLHSAPPCREFEDLEPDEFLHRARTKSQN